MVGGYGCEGLSACSEAVLIRVLVEEGNVSYGGWTTGMGLWEQIEVKEGVRVRTDPSCKPSQLQQRMKQVQQVPQKKG